MPDPFTAATATRLREDNAKLRQQLDEANRMIAELHARLRDSNSLREKAQEERNRAEANCTRIWVQKISDLRRGYRRLYAATKFYVDAVTAYYLVKSMGKDAGEHPDGSMAWQAVVAALYECSKSGIEETEVPK